MERQIGFWLWSSAIFGRYGEQRESPSKGRWLHSKPVASFFESEKVPCASDSTLFLLGHVDNLAASEPPAEPPKAV
jgi:hypothetical protein